MKYEREYLNGGTSALPYQNRADGAAHADILEVCPSFVLFFITWLYPPLFCST